MIFLLFISTLNLNLTRCSINSQNIDAFKYCSDSLNCLLVKAINDSIQLPFTDLIVSNHWLDSISNNSIEFDNSVHKAFKLSQDSLLPSEVFKTMHFFKYFPHEIKDYELVYLGYDTVSIKSKILYGCVYGLTTNKESSFYTKFVYIKGLYISGFTSPFFTPNLEFEFYEPYYVVAQPDSNVTAEPSVFKTITFNLVNGRFIQRD